MNVNDACPAGSTSCHRCPAHRDCYRACNEAEWGTWVAAVGSPYNDLGFCERFPYVPVAEAASFQGTFVYAAQTGKAVVARHNFDNIFWSVITIFQILTGMLLEAVRNVPQLTFDSCLACTTPCLLQCLRCCPASIHGLIV
jgi:hypothetical protein